MAAQFYQANPLAVIDAERIKKEFEKRDARNKAEIKALADLRGYVSTAQAWANDHEVIEPVNHVSANILPCERLLDGAYSSESAVKCFLITLQNEEESSTTRKISTPEQSFSKTFKNRLKFVLYLGLKEDSRTCAQT